jgi:hypothetical protein
MEERENESIDFQAVIAQLQGENEELRVRVAQALKSTPLNEAVDSVVVLVQKTDPMRLYIWVAIACAVIITLMRVIEVVVMR